MAAADLGLSVAAGALTTLSPCVFPLLPLVLGGGLQRHRAAPLAMGLGMALSFTVMGLLVGLLGSAIGIDSDTVRRAGAVLLLLFGLVMLVPALDARFTAWMSPLASAADSAAAGLQRDSLGGALGLGALLGLVWSPCAGPLLGSTLALLAGGEAGAGGAGRGALVLGLFGLGAAVPLVAAAYASRSGFARVRGWVLQHGGAAKRVFAVLLLALGAAVLSGGDRWLETQVNQHLPDAWLLLTTRF